MAQKEVKVVNQDKIIEEYKIVQGNNHNKINQKIKII